ncbi:unnamed protein product [Rhizoctonia solani]|uniref:F-box domain-containing protein n=1 Tax=Rhizoctonia solani TaxID=456999 RepID=A0A8H3H0I1_9AGAM|nr:unnamed protein product [Rhizoctonia solani]
MFDSLTQPTFPAIRQWEAAGATLSDALNKYLNLCSSLKTTSLQEGSHPLDLACRVEAALGTLCPKLDQQLALSRATLSRTRNELVPPLHHLPEEVISEVFMNVVFGDYVWEHPDDSSPLSMEDSLTAMRQHLYRLLRVCSTWRNILLTRDVFWSTVGTYNLVTWDHFYGSSTAGYVDLPIQEAKGADLRLVLSLPLPSDFRLDALKVHASRFRTINISAGTKVQPSSIKDTIDIFLKNTPSLLSELSIYHERPGIRDHFVLSEDEHIIPHSSSDWTRFLQIVKSLSVLRIRTVAFSWRHMVFSNRLVELRLQRIKIGHDSEFSGFLNALSSAPELRDLKLISAVTFRDEGVPLGIIQEKQHIMLPKLESLLLEDLYLNTLELLSQWLVAGSCRLSFYLTGCSTRMALSDGSESFRSIEQLCSILRSILVDTLMISTRMRFLGLHDLLKLMPTLKSLKVDAI